MECEWMADCESCEATKQSEYHTKKKTSENARKSQEGAKRRNANGWRIAGVAKKRNNPKYTQKRKHRRTPGNRKKAQSAGMRMDVGLRELRSNEAIRVSHNKR